MSQTFSAASIYGIIDRMDAPQIQAWIDWHKRLKYPPRFINIFTASKFDQAPDVLRLVRGSLPLTTPVWRGFDGKDAWGYTPPEKFPWDDSNFYMRLASQNRGAVEAAELWFARRVKPYLGVIRETGSIVMLLNEANAVFNAPFETACIRLLGEEGVRAGAFAWTAGTPDWPDYQAEVIEEEVRMGAKYDALVMVHEYAGIKTEEQNSLINRNAQLVNKFEQLTGHKPDVFLGEFALAKATISNGQIHLDPDVGWREMGVTDEQYATFIDDTAKAWYVPHKVSFSIYSGPDWGKNGSFGVMKHPALLDRLVGLSESMCFSVEDAMPSATQTQPVIMARPAEATMGIRAKIKSIPSEFRYLRADHDYTAAITGEVKAGDLVRRFEIPICRGPVSAFSSGTWIFLEKLDGNTVVASGYVWKERIVWEAGALPATQEVPIVVVQEPPPQPSPASDGGSDVLPPPPQETWPEPPPPPVNVKKSYSLVIDVPEDRHAVIEQQLMTILAGLIYFGQAMSGATVTLESTAVT